MTTTIIEKKYTLDWRPGTGWLGEKLPLYLESSERGVVEGTVRYIKGLLFYADYCYDGIRFLEPARVKWKPLNKKVDLTKWAVE